MPNPVTVGTVRETIEGILSKPLSAPYRSGPSRDLAQGEEPGQPGEWCGRGRRSGDQGHIRYQNEPMDISQQPW
jgi:hypothetical protein